jgi:hypothetical protein
MTAFSAIWVLDFSERKEEWPIWSETFLAKAKRTGIKDVLLEKWFCVWNQIDTNAW